MSINRFQVKHILHTVNDLLTDFDTDCDIDVNVSIDNPRVQYNQEQFHRTSAQHRIIKNGETATSNAVQYSSSFTDHTEMGAFQNSVRRRSNSISGDLLKCVTSPFDINDVEHYQPKLVRTTNKRRYDKTLRTLHELCQSSAKKGINKLRFVQKYFSKNLPTLKLERRDGEVIYPQKGLVTFGENVQLNFNQDV